MTVATTFGIGTTQGGIATLESIGIIDPASSFQPFTSAYKGADGLKKGEGAARANWHWDLIHFTDRALIRAYVTGLGTAVHIRMPDNEGAWHEYSANMGWPEGEEDQYATRTRDLSIEFTHLIQEA